MKYKIILASASKRRSKILKECGIPHRVVASNVPEKMDHKMGAKLSVLHNARVKAEKIATRYKEGFVIGADTVVLLEKRLIGKPKTPKEARSFLKTFSGKTILVYTGLCVIDVKKRKSAKGIDVSKVRVKRLSRKKIYEFVKIAGPNDKAGGFSIEGPGAFIFDNIEGSFYNILGLPMMKLDELFEKLGVDLLSPDR
ncbi:MAG: septum formation protein Maf [Candidatus Omnitrophica bacterium]|nr:septum formation protein Maf [Candidatus Omnitrophota bacterium]